MAHMQQMALAGGFPGVINDALPDGGAADTLGTFGIDNDGGYTISTDQTGDWVSPASSAMANQYEVKVDLVSGTFDSGSATGTWLACSTSRSWSVSDPGGTTTKTVTFDISFRPVGGSTQSTQANVQLEVQSFS